uniref:Uncharacterized protein n=1 Tax=Haptolina brevifila TaxID=156173 RepID=A0A7S2JDU2_9EUKA
MPQQRRAYSIVSSSAQDPGWRGVTKTKWGAAYVLRCAVPSRLSSTSATIFTSICTRAEDIEEHTLPPPTSLSPLSALLYGRNLPTRTHACTCRPHVESAV